MINADYRLTVSHISFSYGQNQYAILHDLSFDIPLPSRVVVLGLNGSGKTTFLNLLLGLLKSDSGTIFLNKLSGVQNLSSLNGSIGFLPQMENIPFDYMVHEYILLGRIPFIATFSMPTAEDELTVTTVMKSLQIDELSNNRLREISGGELQRVRLARILAQEPEIILMDEPATHLDIKNKRSLYKLINEFKNQGKTVFYSSHDPLDVLDNSDFCLLMNKKLPALLIATQELHGTPLLSEYFETDLQI